MKQNCSFLRSLGAAGAGICLLTGCVGFNHTLFMTKSNAGLDMDTKPPTLEVSIARREAVIAPTFEGGKTPPVLASFKVENTGVGAFFFGVGSTFAGGDAALAMGTLYGDPDDTDAEFDSKLELSAEPKPKFLGIPVSFPKAGEVRPFIFGTDTSFGAKIAWSGMTAQYPDTVRIGFHRKEAALAPVFASEQDGQHSVKMPSFLATVDNSTQGGSPGQTGTKHLQYFATGDAATKLALRRDIRAAMLERADPLGKQKADAFINRSYAKSTTAKDLQKWVNSAPNVAEKKKRQDAMKAWIPAGAGYTFADLLNRSDLEPERQKFLTEKGTELNIPRNQ